MNMGAKKSSVCLIVLLTALNFSACKGDDKSASPKELPDLNEQIRPYVTVEITKVRAGPGPQFRTIAEIRQNSKVQVVGRDGDWALIVSKKGNAPGFIELASVRPSEGEEQASPGPAVEGKYETLTDTQVHSGPGLHYPVVADVRKGTKVNVVNEEKGWLKIESKRGNKPGYVEASLARPLGGQ
jgi:uncharacterized protein YgiM (DUF1202 family)